MTQATGVMQPSKGGLARRQFLAIGWTVAGEAQLRSALDELLNSGTQ